jgi:NADH-quinone oxidoreductase subunit N
MPDALESAPPAASAVLASVGKVAPLAAIAYLLGAQVLPGTRPASLAAVVTLVAGMACASIVFGNLAALRQKSFARMLGYSAIAQVGYGLVSVLYPGAVENTIVFAVLYALAALGSFLFIVAMREIDPEWDGSIAGLAGLSKRAPLLAASLAVLMLSLTGIPLTAGFWGKLFAFTNAYAGGALWLVVVAMLGSVVSFGYYGGVLRAAFMEEPPSDPAPVAPGRAGRAVVLIAALVLLAGIVPFIVTVAR